MGNGKWRSGRGGCEAAACDTRTAGIASLALHDKSSKPQITQITQITQIYEISFG